MGTLTTSTIHLPAWDHVSTCVLEKELFLVFFTKRDPKTKVKDTFQGLAWDWGRNRRVPYHSTQDLFTVQDLEKSLCRKSSRRGLALVLPLTGYVRSQTFISMGWNSLDGFSSSDSPWFSAPSTLYSPSSAVSDSDFSL